jgi:NAD-dependent SIR2 family protein deacetylase
MNHKPPVDPIALAAELLAQADSLVIVAGAGMGVDSGLPDFRGDTGFWNAYRALGRAGLRFAQVASPRTFETDAALAWGFYGHRLDLYRRTPPQEGFQILHAWGQRMPHGAFVFTSNVDGHFQRAGFPEDAVHECHGSIHWLQCLVPCSRQVHPADDAHAVTIDTDRCRWIGDLPTCPDCGSPLRPNILMFDDFGWLSERYDTQRARLNEWLDTVQRPVVVELGAGTAIPSARNFSHAVLRHHGGRLVRINPREPQVPTQHDVGLAMGALEALTEINRTIEKTR